MLNQHDKKTAAVKLVRGWPVIVTVTVNVH